VLKSARAISHVSVAIKTKVSEISSVSAIMVDPDVLKSSPAISHTNVQLKTKVPAISSQDRP
jgi:hypothetical protein